MGLWAQTRKPEVGTGMVSEVQDLKAHFDALFHRFGAPPAEARFEAGQLGPIGGEWTRFARSAPGRVILYFHGGGFLAGSPESHRAVVGRLAEAAEADAFSPRYRLAPDCVFPAAVRDGIDAYRALLASG